MSQNDIDIVEEMLTGGLIRSNDPRMSEVWKIVFNTLKLSPALNASTDVDQIRKRLSEIIGSNVDKRKTGRQPIRSSAMRKFIYILFLGLISCSYNKKKQEGRGKISTEQLLTLNDRHVHIMSPQLIDLWKGMGIPFSREDYFYSNIDTILATSGANSISLISMAYVYSSKEFGGGTENVIEKVRAENDYLARAKSRYPNRVKAYFGIDPLHNASLDEIKRCHQVLKLDGIKLHHNASQVYLTETEHVRKIKAVFQYASENQIPILMHFDNGHPKFGKRDVEILTDSVLRNLESVNLQIAHLGTSGGFNQKTRNVLNAFIDLFNSNHPILKHKITFDISAVCLDKDADGVSRLSDRDFTVLADYSRKLGFDRIAFGTDYPLYRSSEYLEVLISKLNLTTSEVAELCREK